jgi:hypothetical protein
MAKGKAVKDKQDGTTERRVLSYKGNEAAWEFFNAPWETNDEGDLICPAESYWSMNTYRAFHTERAYRDCVVTGKWYLLYGGGGNPELIVRALDSRRFYAVRFGFQRNLPSDSNYIMASIWKGSSDGYQRMLGYRRKVGIFRNEDTHKRYAVRVECVGPEILVFFEDNFVCAVTDDEYPIGLVGVGSVGGKPVWTDLAVEGTPAVMTPPWSMAETKLPRQFTVAWDPGISKRQSSADATLLPGEEILVKFSGDDEKEFVTRSRDYGLTWDKPAEGRFGYYLPSRRELWHITMQHNPDVTWVDQGRNFDELNMDNFWNVISRSGDGGKTWSESERLDVPFPVGKAYAPIKGKAGGRCMAAPDSLGELSDGTVAMTFCWRNSPDGNYTSDQVQFGRTSDGGKTWSLNPVDVSEWERNEAMWVELADGELLCIMRSNYTNSLGQSRSRDGGKTWSKVSPAGIPFFGASAPSIIRTRDNVLLLAVRNWGLFTSLDNGWTWSLPTHIRGYSGSGGGANLLEMADGRILVLNATHGNAPNGRIMAQFIRVDKKGAIHPALPGPVK